MNMPFQPSSRPPGRRAVRWFATPMLLLILGLGVDAPNLAHAAAPGNDNYTGRTSIVLDHTVSYDTTEATGEPSDYEAILAACGIDIRGLPLQTVWFDYTATSSQRLVVDPGDSFVSIVSGDPGTFVGAHCALFNSAFDAVAGTTYHLLVGGNGAVSGSFAVRPAPPPPTIAATLDPVATLDATNNQVTFSGSVTCTGAPSAQVVGRARQAVGRFFIDGLVDGSSLASCDGSPHPWSGTTQFPTGLFGKGTMTLDAIASACNATDCSASSVAGNVSVQVVNGVPAPPAPPPSNATITIDPTAQLDVATNTATVTGTLKCTGTSVIINSRLRQTYRRVFIDGFDEVNDPAPCDGVAHHWSMPIAALNGRFAGGQATVDADVATFGQTGAFAGFGTVTATVRLKPFGDAHEFGKPTGGPVDPRITVSIARRAELDASANSVTVRATITCTGPFDDVFVFTEVHQFVGRVDIAGFGFGVDPGAPLVPNVCDGVPHESQMTSIGGNGLFAPGKATALVTASGVNFTDGSNGVTASRAAIELVPARQHG